MSGAVRGRWLLAGVLAACVAAEAAWPEAPAAVPGVAAEQAVEARAGQGQPVGEAIATALQRPLFTPGRRPAAARDAAVPGAVGSAEPPRLAGILLTGDARRAIFDVQGQAGRVAVVGEGGQVGPWRVEAIRAGEVRLAGPDGARLVRPAFSPVTASLNGSGQLPISALADTSSAANPFSPAGIATLLNAPVFPAARIPR